MKFNIIIDTCIWISFFDPGKNPKLNLDAANIIELISDHNILLPFPTLYEFVDSRLSRKMARLEFEKLLKKPNIVLIEDDNYKEIALNNFFEVIN